MIADVKHELARISIILPMFDLAIFLLPEWYAIEGIFGSSEPPLRRRTRRTEREGQREGGEGRVARRFFIGT